VLDLSSNGDQLRGTLESIGIADAMNRGGGHLTTLNLSGNGMSGMLDVLFLSASPAPLLVNLDLSYNRFEGTVHQHISNILYSLEALNLAGNRLVGTFPRVSGQQSDRTLGATSTSVTINSSATSVTRACSA